MTPDLAGNNLIQQLLDRVNLVELISHDVKLRHNGRNWVGLCPFHGDSKPSFSVNPEKGLYYCFGCQEGGNALSYVKKTRALSTTDAIEELARQAGFELPANWRGNAAEYRERKEKRDLMFECNEAAQLWFATRLHGSGGQAARDYLTGRGLDRDSIIHFGVGYAPSEGGLQDALASKGLSIGAAMETGLLGRRQTSNAVIERFRGRVTFPIRDANGRVAGFSARTMDPEGQPKYINSSDSEVYQKGSLLYGFWEAREGIRHRGGAILVEGQMDVIAMHRAGFVNTVAPLGTALTRQQLQILRRLGDSVTVLFDGDGAGRKAARRAVGMLLEEGLNGRVANPPDKADPDSILKTQGAPALQALVDAAMPALEWLVKQLATQHDGSIAGRSKAMREGLEWARLIQDDIERGQFTEELGRTLGISGEALRKSGSPTRRSGTSSPAAPGQPQDAGEAQAPVDQTQLDLLATVVVHPQFLRRVLDQVGDLESLFQPSVAALLLSLNELLEEEGKLDVGLVLERVSGELRSSLGGRIMDGPEFSEADARALVDAKIGKLKRDLASQQKDAILAQMRKAQAAGDTEMLEKLATELDSVRKSIRSAAGLACL